MREEIKTLTFKNNQDIQQVCFNIAGLKEGGYISHKSGEHLILEFIVYVCVCVGWTTCTQVWLENLFCQGRESVRYINACWATPQRATSLIYI